MTQVTNEQTSNINYASATVAVSSGAKPTNTENSIMSQNQTSSVEDLKNKLRKILKGTRNQEFIEHLLENINDENYDIYAKKMDNVSKAKELIKNLIVVNDSIKLGVNVDKYEEIFNLYKEYELNTNELFVILDKAKSPEEKSKILDTLISTFNYVLEEVKNPSKNKKQVGKLVEEYSFVQACGVSIEEYKKYADTEFRALTESKEALIKKYGSFIDGIKALHEQGKKILEEKIQGKSPEEAEQIKAEFIKEQNAKMLAIVFNSTPEEQVALIENLEMMHSDNMMLLLEAIKLKNNNPKEYAEKLHHYRHPKRDCFGHNLSKRQNQDLTEFVACNMDNKGLSDFHSYNYKERKEFFEINKEAIANIFKAQRGELGRELTEEELKIKERLDNYFTAISAGEITGTSQNIVIDKNEVDKLLEQFVNDAKGYEDFSDVLSQINEIVQNNNGGDYTELINKLDSLTDGEYSHIVENSKSTEASNESENTNVGFNQNNNVTEDIIKALNDKKNELYNYNILDNQRNTNDKIVSSKYHTNKVSFKERFKNMTPAKRIETLKNFFKKAGSDTKKRMAKFVANRENLISHAGKFGFSFILEVYKQCNDKNKEKIINGGAGITLTFDQKAILSQYHKPQHT